MKKRARYKSCKAGRASLALLFTVGLWMQPLVSQAAEYHVGVGKGHATLEALRSDPSVIFTSGDKIIIHGDDNSLTAAFNFSGAEITIDGAGVIKPGSSDIRFIDNAGSIIIGSNLQIEGFNLSSGNGGAIYSGGAVEISGDSNTFYNNTAKSGGAAIYSAGDVDISGNYNNFEGNNAANGSGGAIYSAGDVNIAGSYSNFEGNSASNGSAGAIYSAGDVNISGSNNNFKGNSASNGGAIYSSITTTISGNDNVFYNNTAKQGGAIYSAGDVSISGNYNSFEENSVSNGSGGAIYSAGDVSISGNYNSFEENSVSNGSGGAIYSAGDVNISGSNNNFKGNSASNSSSNNSDMGGAIYSTGTVNLSGSTISFECNSAKQGGAIYSTGTVNLSGSTSFERNSASQGGAIYSSGLNISAGENSFANNFYSTTGKGDFTGRGTIYSNGDVNITGGTNSFKNNNIATASVDDAYGGAIYSTRAVVLSGGKNIFTDNSVSSDNNSYGGAIYSNGFNITNGENAFYNNTAQSGGGAIFSTGDVAVTGGKNSFKDNSADSGSGGAIYVKKNGSFLAVGGDMLFKGNFDAAGANAVYMANEGGGNKLKLGATAGSTLYLYDPIRSNSTQPGLVIDINPDASHLGTVLFDSHTSEIYGATTVHNGTMKLVNGAQYGAAVDTGSFVLGSQARLLAAFDGNTVKIAANDITLAGGSTVSVDWDGGFAGYNADNLTGQEQTVLEFEAASSFSNEAAIANETGMLAAGAFDVPVAALWKDNSKKALVLKTSDKAAYNPGRGGSYSVRASGAIALANPTGSVISDRGKFLFSGRKDFSLYGARNLVESKTNDKGQNLWATPFYDLSQMDSKDGQAGYKAKTHGFALGYDKKLGEDSFLGLAVTAAWPHYYGGNATVKGDDVRLMLYGGTQLKSGWQFMYSAGLGRADLDSRRWVYNEMYSPEYQSRTWQFSLGLARQINWGPSRLRPYVDYEYLKVRTDAYSEGAGLYALSYDRHSQEISRVRVGFDYRRDVKGGYWTAGLFWLGQYGDRAARTTAFFNAAGRPASGFTSYAAPEDENNVGLQLGLSIPMSSNSDFVFGYTGVFGSKGKSQNFDMSFIYRF